MPKGIKKQYELLRKKHKLPAFADVDREFEIGKIEGDGFLLREIRKKIAEKVSDAGSLLEEVLHPETNLADLYESRVFDEREKQMLFDVYKRLMVALRRTAELSIESDEKLEALFINSFSEEWKKIKPQLATFVKRLRESWEKDTDEGEKAAYMG